MRDDFCIFILSHGRADSIVTADMLLKNGGYGGKWFVVLDNEDEQEKKYRNRFGDEHIVVFDKNKVMEWTDTADNFNEHRGAVYARNQVFNVAREMGFKYFLMFDDDIKRINYRIDSHGHLLNRKCKQIERIINDMIEFMIASDAFMVSFCSDGDMVGGLEGGTYKKKLIRKCMYSMFCRVDRPVNFIGTQNEDISAYVLYGSQGEKIFSITEATVAPAMTQGVKGGMTEIYKEYGTFLKSFYPVMAMPSAVKVSMMGETHRRIHHKVDWDRCVPKILSENTRRWIDEG